LRISKLLTAEEAAFLGYRLASGLPGTGKIILVMTETFDIEPALGFMVPVRVCDPDSKIFWADT
jgi:hypothetical protein